MIADLSCEGYSAPMLPSAGSLVLEGANCFVMKALQQPTETPMTVNRGHLPIANINTSPLPAYSQRREMGFIEF